MGMVVMFTMPRQWTELEAGETVISTLGLGIVSAVFPPGAEKCGMAVILIDGMPAIITYSTRTPAVILCSDYVDALNALLAQFSVEPIYRKENIIASPNRRRNRKS
jgi:hypothetical protein